MSRASFQALTPDVCEARYHLLHICHWHCDWDTETGLVNGFAWLIYFNVVKTEQLETETRGLETDTETQGFEPRLRLWNLSLEMSWDRDSNLENYISGMITVYVSGYSLDI